MRPDIPALTKRIVLERAGRVCENCGRDRPLEMHHVTYRETEFGQEEPHHLKALCRECHHDEHIWAGKFYANIDDLNDEADAFDCAWWND